MSVQKRSACRPCGEHINTTCISDKSSMCGKGALFSIHTTRTDNSDSGPGRLAFLPFYNEEDKEFPPHYTLFNIPEKIFGALDLPPEMYLFHLSDPEAGYSRIETLAQSLAFGKTKPAYPQTPQCETRFEPAHPQTPRCETRFGWEIHDNYDEALILDEVRISMHPSLKTGTGCCLAGNTHTAINSKGVLWLASHNSVATENDKPYRLTFGTLKDKLTLNRVMWSFDKKEALFLTLERYNQTKIDFDNRRVLVSPYNVGPLSLPIGAIQRDLGYEGMPRRHTIVGGSVPFYNKARCRAYLLAYLNKASGANYTMLKSKIEKTNPWEYIMGICKEFCKYVESDRTSSPNSVWNAELRFVQRSADVFDSFYIGLQGNNNEVWVFAFAGGNRLGKMDRVETDVFHPVTALRLPRKITIGGMSIMEFHNTKHPLDNVCDLPLFSDCLGAPQHGVHTGPTSFCAGRASNSFQTHCGTQFSILSADEKDNFIENYCGRNKDPVECRCFNRMENDMFRYITKEHGSKLVVHDSCWWKPCLSRNRGMLTHSTDIKMCDSEVRFNLLWLKDVENIDLSGLTQVSLETPPQDQTGAEQTIAVMKMIRDTWMLALAIIGILVIITASTWYKHHE